MHDATKPAPRRGPSGPRVMMVDRSDPGRTRSVDAIAALACSGAGAALGDSRWFVALVTPYWRALLCRHSVLGLSTLSPGRRVASLDRAMDSEP